jgi:hypothetical protein
VNLRIRAKDARISKRAKSAKSVKTRVLRKMLGSGIPQIPEIVRNSGKYRFGLHGGAILINILSG